MRASSNRLAARYSCSPMLSPPISTSHRPVCSRGGSRCSGRPPPGEAPGGRAQGRSKRSRFMTLSHAATKSCTNFSLRVVAGVDLGDGSELGVRPEDEVDSGAGPSELAGGAVAALVDVLGERGTPLGAHVEQVHEEVVGQRPRPVGEDAVPGLPGVGAEDPQAADEHRHLRGGQAQQAGPVDRADPRAGVCPRAGSSCGTRQPLARARRTRRRRSARLRRRCARARTGRARRARRSGRPARRRRTRPGRSDRRGTPSSHRSASY